MDEFVTSAYLRNTKDDSERTPEETLVEYVTAYKRWARDCHNWCREHRKQVSELSKGAAREVFRDLQRKYCTPRNRQWERSSDGYFFYGGTYDAQPATDEIDVIDAKTVIITTKAERGPRFRFTLRKQGDVWKLDSLDRSVGNGWERDHL